MTDNPIHHPGSADSRQPWLRAVDFSAPSGLAPDQAARLRRLGEDFCAAAVARAMGELQLSIELQQLWTRDGTWKELQPFPADDAVTLTLEASAGGQLHLALDPTLASLIVERLLGAESDPSKPLRAVTTIDRALMSRFNAVLVEAFSGLWEEATATILTPGPVRANRELIAVQDPKDHALLTAYEIRIAGAYSVLYLFVPHATIEPVAANLSRPTAHSTDGDQSTARRVQARIGKANVVVEVLLGEVHLSAEQITGLKAGDHVPLSAKLDQAAALSVDGIPIQFGHIGRSGTHRAVQVGAGPSFQGAGG